MTESYTEVIYVAGPYRSPIKKGIQHNIDRALVAAQRLWKMGYVAVCPHSNSPHFEGEAWWYLQGYLMLLRRCDAIYVLKGSQNSEGTQAEIREAHVQGLKVYYEGVSEPEDLLQ
jgi:hypothetical protein